jgi:hypothetical protein
MSSGKLSKAKARKKMKEKTTAVSLIVKSHLFFIEFLTNFIFLNKPHFKKNTLYILYLIFGL